MARTRTTTIKVSGPFSLAAAIDALDLMAPHRGESGGYEGWHVIGERPFNIRVRQVASRRLVLGVDGERSSARNSTQPRRSCGACSDSTWTPSASTRRRRRRPRPAAASGAVLGVRPVTAPTPLSALVWTIIADLHGPERARVVLGRLGGGEEPAGLARLHAQADASRLGPEPATVERLRILGERGLTGAFGVELLRSMPVDAARRWICRNGEVGAATADLVLVAGAGRRDVVPSATPQLIAAVERYYGVARDEAGRRIDELSRRWGEFASWAAYLLVEAARRDVSARATT